MSAPLTTAIEVLWLAWLPLALGALPGILAVRALRLPPAFWIPVTLAAGAFLAYIEFWIFFFWPEPAKPIAASVLVLSVGGFLLRLESKETRAYLREVDAWLPGVLALLVLCAYLACLTWPGVPAWDRFTIPVPIGDNLVPSWLAERIYAGAYHLTPPPPLSRTFFVTRSSDRPPLLAALVVALRPVMFRYDVWSYQILGSAGQLAWLPALYALGRAMALSRRQLLFALAGTAGSGFFLMHSLLTWPKFIAAAPFLVALALMIQATRHPPARPFGMSLAIGALLGLSLLGHGGPFFSIVALPIFVVLARAWWLVRPTSLVAMGAAFAILIVPWTMYQRFYDPPGNALVKLHLAGVEDSEDPRGTLEAIADAYRGVTLSDYVAGRLDNLREQWLVFGKSGRSAPVDWVQWQQFFHHVPALDVLALGVFAFALRRWRRPAASSPKGDRWLECVSWYAIGATLVWVVLLFPAGTAMIHHGSYATTALLFFCAAAWVAVLPRRLGDVILAAHVAVFLACWLLPMRVMHTVSHAAVWRPWIAAIMVAACVAFAAALTLVPPAPDAADRAA